MSDKKRKDPFGLDAPDADGDGDCDLLDFLLFYDILQEEEKEAEGRADDADDDDDELEDDLLDDLLDDDF